MVCPVAAQWCRASCSQVVKQSASHAMVTLQCFLFQDDVQAAQQELMENALSTKHCLLTDHKLF